MADYVEELSVRIGANIEGLEKALRQSESKIKAFGDSATKIGKRMTAGLTLPLGAAAAFSIKAASDFESSFANIRKTVNASESQFREIEGAIRDMAREIPTSVNELNNLAGVAGQLGIEAENIVSFTRTIADLGETTDISGEQAALSLSRFMNVMGTASGDVDRLGSTIVGLGNNFAAMESEIVGIGTSLAAFGRQIGLSESDVLAFATTIAASGGQAEAASTAFQKTAATIQEATIEGGVELDKFANVAGQSSEQFRKSFQENAAGAISDFLKGLGRIQKEGGSTASVLEDLGLADQRLQREFGKVIGNLDDLDKALEMGNKEWQMNTALTEEAEKRYNTFAARAEVLRNNLNEVGIQIGDILIPYVEKLIEGVQGAVDWFDQLTDSEKKNVLALGATVAAIGPAVAAFGFMAQNVRSTIKALQALRVVAMANPWVLLASAITAAGAALYFYSRQSNDLIDQQKELASVNVEAQKSIASEQAELKKLLSTARDETLSKNRRQKAIEKLNEIVPQYNNNLSLETINTDEARKATDKYVQSLLNASKARAAEQKLQEIQSRRIDLENFTGEFEGLGDRVKQIENLRSRIGSLNKEIADIRDGDFFVGKGDLFTRLLGERADLQERLKDIEGDVGETIDNVNKDFNTIEKSLLKTITSTGGAISDYVAPEASALSEEFFKIKDTINSLSGEELMRAEARMFEIRHEAEKYGIALERAQKVLQSTNTRLPAPEFETPRGLDSIPDLGLGALTDGGPTLGLNAATLEKNQQAASAALAALEQDMAMINQQSIAFGATFDASSAKVSAYRDAIQSLIESGLGPMSPEILRIKEEMQQLNEQVDMTAINAQQLGAAFGNAFQQSVAEAESGIEGIRNAIANGVREIIKAFLAQAIASFIANSFKANPIAGLVAGAAAPGIVNGIFDSAIPAFANGAIIYGDTIGRMGEYPGARTNPEIVAPLDKLKNMISSGSQDIRIKASDIRLEGQDILISLERAQQYRDSTT